MIMTKKKALAIANAIINVRNVITDEQALAVTDLYPEWESGKNYQLNERVMYNGTMYRVLVGHTAQADWAPSAAPSLFAKVLIPNGDTIYNWEQPDSTNPYMNGDKVKHNEKIWVSTVDNNVWEPGVYGWEEVAE